MPEALVVARAKAQQNYCHKIKSPRKSRSLAWKNNEVLEVLELLDIMQFIIVLIMRTPRKQRQPSYRDVHAAYVVVFLYGSLRFLKKLKRNSSGNSPSAILKQHRTHAY